MSAARPEGSTRRAARNILFVMYDQLRFDYLSCAGHATLHTPNFDWFAEHGVRFDRAYCQSPVCGSSRMSFYTGRYVHSHGAAWNNWPLKVGEWTLGDHLRALGMDAWLIGKTHMRADAAGLQRLGIAADSVIGARICECGFDVFERDDGLWTEGPDGFYDSRRSPYNAWLNAQGYAAENPWHQNANAGIDDDGQFVSAMLMAHGRRAANVRTEHAETPWLTGRAIDFLGERESGTPPWLCHLSFIKPHWPYIVPAPYHERYGTEDMQVVNRHARERIDPHPVYAAFMGNAIGRAFQRDEVRDVVVPAYMGLVKQCDDELGRLREYLEASGRIHDTMVVITADHGDYLGDHWLGEKDLFHEPSVRIPLIVYDPSDAADATRGSACDALVESIDLAATFIEVAGGEVPTHIVEGRSLLPVLHGDAAGVGREFAVSEYHYAMTPMAKRLGLERLTDARLFMVCDERYKFVHAEGGFRPMLFDLDNDPNEFDDLGANAASRPVVELMRERLGAWALRESQRTALSDAEIDARRGASRRKGIVLGAYDERDVEPELVPSLRGVPSARPD